jgi:hypothetical protein
VNFAEALAAEEKASIKGPRCSMNDVFAALDKEDQATLREALASSVPSSQIARALSITVGYKIGGHVVQRHRKGGCTCG